MTFPVRAAWGSAAVLLIVVGSPIQALGQEVAGVRRPAIPAAFSAALTTFILSMAILAIRRKHRPIPPNCRPSSPHPA